MHASAVTAKQEALAATKRLPDNVELDEIVYTCSTKSTTD